MHTERRHIVVGSVAFHDVNSKEDNYITDDLAVYNVRDHTRQVFMTFPDDVVESVSIAPAAGATATIR